MHRIKALCISLLLTVLLCGSSVAADLAGRWNVQDPKRPMKSGGKFVIEFLKGGKLKMLVDNPPMKLVIDGTYQLAGTKLTMKMTSQTANGKKMAASREPLIWNLRWKNNNLVYMSDAQKPKKVPVVLTRAR